MTKMFRSAFPLVGLLLFGQGCLGGEPAAGPGGGVWKTADRAETWEQKRALVIGPKVTGDAALFAVLDMEFDPQDRKAIYLGTAEHGVVVSLDGGESWSRMTGLNQTTVRSVAVDPKNKCRVYAAGQNKIFLTTNCGRDWSQAFVDPRPDKVITEIVVDWFNALVVYAGTSEGDVLKSEDAGQTWRIVKRIEGVPVTSIVMGPKDSRLLYVGTGGSGVWKTLDAGKTWIEIRKQFGDELRNARRVTQLAIDPANQNRLYLLSDKAGIIRSDDQGETWTVLNLPAPPGTFTMNAIALDPRNPNVLVFTGPTSFSVSTDAGQTWFAKKLPTTHAGAALLIDPEDSTIYLGTQPQKK